LIGALCLPGPAYALRPRAAGMEEKTSVTDQLAGALQGTATSVPAAAKQNAAEAALQIFADAMKALVNARYEEDVGDAVVTAIERFIDPDGIAFYAVDPLPEQDGNYQIRNEIRHGEFRQDSKATNPTQAKYEKAWVLQSPGPEGIRLIDRRLELGGKSAQWIDRAALQEDAAYFGGDKVNFVYYVVLRKEGKPWGLVLFHRWRRGGVFFQEDAKETEPKERHYQEVKRLTETLAQAASFAMENVKLYQAARDYQEIADVADLILLKGPLHDLKNSIKGVGEQAYLLKGDLPDQSEDLKVLAEGIEQLSRELVSVSVKTLRGDSEETTEKTILPERPRPAGEPMAGLVRLNDWFHAMALHLWKPILSGNTERIRKILGRYERIVEKERISGRLTLAESQNLLWMLQQWETLATGAVDAREELKTDWNNLVGKLKWILEQVQKFDALQEELNQTADKAVLKDQPWWNRLEKLHKSIDGLRKDVPHFIDVSAEKIGLQPGELKTQDLLSVLREALESSNGSIDPKGLLEPEEISQEPLNVESRVAFLAKHALLELVINAQKYGAQRIQVSAAYNPDERRLTVEVKDDGPGIRKAMRNQLFRRPAKKTRITRDDSSHNGLWVLQQRLKAIGGDLKLEWSRMADEPARQSKETGSRFLLEVPVMPLPAMPQAAGAEEMVFQETRGPMPLSDLAGMMARMTAVMAHKHRVQPATYRIRLEGGATAEMALIVPETLVQYGADIVQNPLGFSGILAAPDDGRLPWRNAFVGLYRLLEAGLREGFSLSDERQVFVSIRAPVSLYPEAFPSSAPLEKIEMQFILDPVDPKTLRSGVPMPYDEERLTEYLSRLIHMYQRLTAMEKGTAFHLSVGSLVMSVPSGADKLQALMALSALVKDLLTQKPALQSDPAGRWVQKTILVNGEGGQQVVQILLADKPLSSAPAAGVEEIRFEATEEVPVDIGFLLEKQGVIFAKLFVLAATQGYRIRFAGAATRSQVDALAEDLPAEAAKLLRERLVVSDEIGETAALAQARRMLQKQTPTILRVSYVVQDLLRQMLRYLHMAGLRFVEPIHRDRAMALLEAA